MKKGGFYPPFYFSVNMALNVWETSPYTDIHVKGGVKHSRAT